jgi:hypothetical protein
MKFIRLNSVIWSLPVLVAGLLCSLTPARAAESGAWHYDLSLNLFMAGLSGDLAARGVPISVDAGFDDIVRHLEFSAAGRLTASRDLWSISTEVSYLGAGGETTAAKADLKQWLVEPTVGYQLSGMFTGFTGVRYQSVKTDVRGKGPLGLSTGQTQDWFDPIVGFLVKMPLGAKWTFDGRFDVGGFGVGSDLTWQIFPYFNWRFNDTGSLQLGWRWLATDYEDGSAASLFRYDVMLQGPQAGITFSF